MSNPQDPILIGIGTQTDYNPVSPATPMPVSIITGGSALPRLVTGSTLTRPADTTAYAFGDLVANSTTAGSVTPGTIAAASGNDVAGRIKSARLITSSTSISSAMFRLHLFNSLPTVTNGDNGVWLPTKAGYLGSFDITVDRQFSDGAVGLGYPTLGDSLAFTPVTGGVNLYYLLEARGAYTPTSAGTFIPVLEVI
jgi:hypothetical protein